MQTCVFTIGPWSVTIFIFNYSRVRSYTATDITLAETEFDVNDTEFFTGNTEWEFLSLTSNITYDQTYIMDGIFLQAIPNSFNL